MFGFKAAGRLVLVLILTKWVAGCEPVGEDIRPLIENAVTSLADPSVPVESAAREVEAAFQAAFAASEVENVGQIYHDAMLASVKDTETFVRMAERSEEVGARRIQFPYSDAPESAENAVLFVNGMLAQYTEFCDNLRDLGLLLKPLQGSYDFHLYGLYNPTGGAWVDGSEAVVQNILDWIRTYQIGQKDTFPDWYLAELTYFLIRYQNITIVAHSQGNFYTQEAIANLPINLRTRINLIQVGSPASNWPAGLRSNVRLDQTGDLVSCLAGTDIFGYDYDQTSGNPLFELLLNVLYPGLDRNVELQGTIGCWVGALPYEIYGFISTEEFFAFHSFENYMKGEIGNRLNRYVESSLTNGEQLSESSMPGIWVMTDVTPETGGRTYEEYHVIMTLYRDGTADLVECKFFCVESTATWSFDDATSQFSFESADGGAFSAMLDGDTDTFITDGTWVSGNPATLLFVRHSELKDRPYEVMPDPTYPPMNDGLVALE